MVHFKKISVIMLIILSNYYLIAGTYSGGTGTQADPYLISTAEDLIELSKTNEDWYPSILYFVQTAHISFDANNQLVDWDGDGSATWDTEDQLGFAPIGDNIKAFKGHYDGQNHTITNIYINRGSATYVALFGYTNGSNIQNLGLINASIIGRIAVGALVGQAAYNSQITNCFSTGSVVGNGSGVAGLIGAFYTAGTLSYSYSTASVTTSDTGGGGLVGSTDASTIISYCYSTGMVSSSSNYVGGFVGLNYGAINNCYSLGNVVRSSGSSIVFSSFCSYNAGQIQNCYSTGSVNFNTDRGFIGQNASGTFSNNFFDSQTSGQTSGIGATATTTANMKTQTTFTNASWDFGTDNTDWIMSSNITFAGYPTFRWTGGYSVDPGGTVVSSLPHLVWIAENSARWASSYTQSANIFTWTTPSWNANKGWTPIGNNTTKFTGQYNGQNYSISNLYFNNNSTEYVGFLGYTNGATIQNLGNLNVYFKGSAYVGGLAGTLYNNSHINLCYSTGFVSGVGNQIGGLVGAITTNSTMANSYFIGTVSSGGMYVGGFVGSTFNTSAISKCFSSGYVLSSFMIVGGFIGMNAGNSTINDCYTLSKVIRTSGSFTLFGGFCGYNEATIQNSYSTGNITYLGDVNPTQNGFVGFSPVTPTPTYADNFFDKETSEQTNGLGATAKTTSEMKTQSTFTNWNFTPSTGVWSIESGSNISYPYLQAITYDTPGARPEVNPIPGLEVSLCQNTIYVDASYNDQTSGWGTTHFADLSLGLAGVCASGTVNIAIERNTSFTGDVDFSGLTVIVGDYNFDLTGDITDGEVQVVNLGSLIMKDLAANTTKTFPITDGTYNYTMTVYTTNNTSPDIWVRISDLDPSGNINNDFWDISGPTGLDATVTLRVDKAAIAPKTLNSNTQVRYYDSTDSRYVPANGNNFSIEEFDTYYIITITGVDKF